MTQEVQPLTWQKRTNLEEHQQFFSKINEIISNLAPTVGEAEQAIASANAAIATANAASASADAASQQAQTAASTVAGYNTRLTTAEGDIDAAEGDIAALQGRMGTAEGNIIALQNVQGDYVKKDGAAQTVTSQIMVPTTATGLRDTQIANGTRIQNDLAAYEPMLRDTGNKDVLGDKRFLNGLIGRNLVADVPAAGTYTFEVSFEGKTTQFAKVEVYDYINNMDSVYWDFYMVWNGSAAGAKVYGRRMGPTPSAYKPKFTVDNGVLKLIYFGLAYHTVFLNVTNARSWTDAMIVDVVRAENPDYSGLTLADVIE